MRSTRGYGLLENTLSHYRQAIAFKLIDNRFRDGNILDIGCGQFPSFLTKVNIKNKYGIDQYFIDDLSNINKYHINLKKVDLSKRINLPFEDNFFNVVTMLAVIEHIEEHVLKTIFFEIHRTLSKNGLLVITTPSNKADKLMRVLAGVKLLSSVEISEHKTLFNLKQLRSFVNEHSKLSIIKSGHFQLFANIYLTAQKK